MNVAKCGDCDQLFEMPEGPQETDTLHKPDGLVRMQAIKLCPPCRQGAQLRGQPPAQEEASAEEEGAEEEAQT